MLPVKRELKDSIARSDEPLPNKMARLSGVNKVAVDVTLPSDEWFDQMYGPLGENSVQSSNSRKTEYMRRKKIPKNNKMKAKKRKTITSTSTSSDLIEIDVSDGENLNEVFPLSSPQTSKKDEEKVKEKGIIASKNEKNKNQKDQSFSDDDIDFVVLFESIAEKQLKKENDQDNDDSDDLFVSSKNKVKKPRIVKNAENRMKNSFKESFGITLYFNPALFKQISNHVDKFKKEFDNFNKSIWTHFTENLQVFPNENITLVAVGSTVNGCGAFNSDMDLCLCMPCIMDGYETPRSYAINRLKKVLRKLINRKSLIQDIQFIPAKVPILKIKFKYPYQKLEVDINVNNVPGIYNSYLIHYYSRIDDRFPALCLIVKHWAKKKGILDACSGYFNSYSLILMVLHFLQCGIDVPILPNLQFLYPEYFHYFRPLDEMKLFENLPKPIPEIPKNNLSVGELLIGFFNYFYNFDYDKYAISVCRGCIYPRSELPRNTRRFKIFIEEPFDFKNTARCVTNEEHFVTILDTFREAVEICACNQPPSLKKLIAN
uniref:PAP-associated domain-containing protein n=1 Tax=Meloidogyne hapla TaxID=6305 RepID=A0A1I8B2U0_MELHA